ncbi:MAG: DUF4838 domain-containing protein, partial [Clostridia bacterium]|nr:DUF4838 domain-containing protein [Clostridia bacterium]
MLSIYKISSHSAVDFAAEELKKYLRMMNPEGGDIQISFDPTATDGFCLGLMQDFCLDASDVKDPVLDDILYIDTDTTGGIIAGGNPRSVLMAVYELLRQQGCRWLFPGVDGEYIPVKETLSPVKLRHVPSCRYRGVCAEGAHSQQHLLDMLDFIPKVGMNVYQSQFLLPAFFYRRYYNRNHNTRFQPEPITDTQIMQWKVQCEAEMSKRGIQFHDVGHGWTAEPFGIDTSGAWTAIDEDAVTEEQLSYMAMLNGKRQLLDGKPINTQFCMSNPKGRKIVADYIADYAEKHRNVDYLHVWLADARQNHCECEECQKKTASDWYLMLMNDIDESLAARKLDTRIVFIVYTDTTWAPVEETIRNPDRFTCMIAPISRSYTKTLTEGETFELPPFQRNKNILPKNLGEYLAHFEEWKKTWKGANLCYEYHFWRHQTYDLSGQILAKRIFEDIEVYKSRDIDGLIACGSERSFFPNGFAYYVYARKQFDLSLTYEELLEDYYSCAYGEDWKQFADYLLKLGDAMGFGFMEGEESEDETVSSYY